MEMNQELATKVVDMLKKLGVSEDLIKELGDELAGKSSEESAGEKGMEVSVEIEKKSGDGEMECPKCGEKFAPPSSDSKPSDAKPEDKKQNLMDMMMASKR